MANTNIIGSEVVNWWILSKWATDANWKTFETSQWSTWTSSTITNPTPAPISAPPVQTTQNAQWTNIGVILPAPKNTELVNWKTPDLWIPVWWTTPTTTTTTPIIPWWIKPETVTTPTTTDADAQKVLDNIYNSNSMTPEQKDYFNKNVFNTPQERDKFLQMTDEQRKSYISNINQANIVTRDANLNAEYNKTVYDSKVAAAKQQSALDEAKAKNELDAQINNFAIAHWTSWRLQSQNMANAIKDQISLWTQTYNNLVASNDRYVQALADEYKYNNTRASNDFNDTMAKLTNDQATKIKSLQDTGAMQTASGLLQAKDIITSTLQAGDVAMQQYSYNLQIGQERVKAMADQLKSQNQFSKDMTEASWWDYLLNSQGGIMTDAMWQPLKKATGKAVEQVITNNQWDVTILYKDWTFSAPEKWIGKKEVEKPIFVDVTWGKQQMVLDPVTGNYKPVWEVIQNTQQMTQYQQAQIDLENKKMWQAWKMTDYQQAQIDLANKKAGINSTINTNLLNTEDWTKLTRWQCWQYVNDVLWTPSKFWDTLQSKIKATNSTTPVIWWAVILSSKWMYEKNWHVWIITDISPDWILTIKSSNAHWDEKVTTDTTSINNPAIKGYYNPALDTQNIPWINQSTNWGVHLVTKKWTVDLSPEQIKWIVEWRINPAWYSRNDPEAVSAIKNAAIAIDPTYSDTRFETAQKTDVAFKSWKYSQQIVALNTTVKHMQEMDKIANKLWNVNFSSLNDLKNAIKKQFWDQDVTNFNYISSVLWAEIAKAYWINSATERLALEDKINSSLSQWQITWVMKMAKNLMWWALDSLQEAYKQWNPYGKLQFVTPKIQSYINWEVPKITPTQQQIGKATPKIIADIKAGKSLSDMKAHSESLWVDSSYIDKIYNANKSLNTKSQPTWTIWRWQQSNK